MDITTMSNDELVAALAENREKATALFALEAPTITQADEATALVASIKSIETAIAARAQDVKDAEAKFAAARQAFSEGSGEASAEGDAEGDAETEAEADTEIEAEVEAPVEASVEAAAEDEDTSEGDEAPEDEETMSASGSRAQRINPRATVAAKVGKRAVRPPVKQADPVVITASSDVPGFATGAPLSGMGEVAKALTNRVKGFAPFNERRGQAAHKASGGAPVIHQFGVASFALDFPAALTASGNSEGGDYAAVQAAMKQDRFTGPEALTAAGWCAPSETVYSFIADYVVDGLVTVPEVSAPRGGLNLTTGPARSSQGTDLDNFGWTQTEAQAIANTVKPMESIVCPSFTEHRLDAVGYGYTIPILTQKAYPELIEDALKFAGVLYAHRTNRRILADMVALSTAATDLAQGASFTDALEALSIVAVKERRKWSIGENATMEVKIPSWVREVFRADMSRRQAVAVDAITNEQINAHFTARGLAVEYVADWAELTGANALFAGSFPAMVFPAGTFIKAVEDVINLSAIYDAASLSVNNYTGVFFEQGILVAKAGYGSTLLDIPVNTGGLSGNNTLDGTAA